MAIYMWREYVPPELCFTANTANSTVQLTKTWSPTAVTLETSIDGSTWSDYTIDSTITLSNIWDKVYIRNKSETTTGFSKSTSNYYYFNLSWSIDASWDVTTLINKNGTDTIIGNYRFYNLFRWCSSLRMCPKIPATTITLGCYYWMFAYCSNLETIPQLPATTLADTCYNSMFTWCSKIKLSTTQDSTYTNAYRIPASWTWTDATNTMANMFTSTWWTFTWTPTINTTYYTSNQVI